MEDSLRSIFTALGYAAQIQRSGGGVGYTFSHLRPVGDRVSTTSGTASGPNSFLRLYDTVYRYGSREGQVLSYAAPEPALAHVGTEFSGGRAGRSCEF